MSKEEFPEGLKIQEKEGPGKLTPLLDKLKKYSFQGYLKINLDEQLEGYITLKDGELRNALLYTPNNMEISGGEALKKLRDLDENENLFIEVHTKVEIDELIEEVGGDLKGDKEFEDYEPSRESFEELAEDVGEEQVAEITEEEGTEEISEEEIEEAEELEEQKEQKEREEKEMEIYDMIITEEEDREAAEEEFPEKFSFEEFVVGENNKLGYMAAREVAQKPSERFNPLLLTSDAGLGKTHLLKAIGDFIQEEKDDINVVYTSAEKCSSDLMQAMEGSMKEDAAEYLHADVLLLDDIQFLAGKEDRQQAIFHLFNRLDERGSQIVISSDRLPEQIPTLKERLISRLKSGLVVNMESPDYETRLEIVKKKMEQQGIELPDEAVELIARNIKKNVREIEGVMNRLIAFSSLLDRSVTMNSVRETVNQYSGAEEDEEEGAEVPRFESGRSYLMEEERPDKSFALMERLAEDKENVYIMTRINPRRLKEDYELGNAEIRWLSSRESGEFKTVRPNLESITYMLEEMIEEGKFVLLDGVEYLVSQTGFDATMQFIRHIVDSISETETVLLITVSPEALKKRQISILERELELVQYEV